MQWLGEGEYTWTHPDKPVDVYPLTTTFIPRDQWGSVYLCGAQKFLCELVQYQPRLAVLVFIFQLHSNNCTVLCGRIVMYFNIKINSEWLKKTGL